MKKILTCASLIFLFVTASQAQGPWERKGDFYFLSKNTRENFSAKGAGSNKFDAKYVSVDGVAFLVKGAREWKDYGRLNLEGNNPFSVPIRAGMKVDELHLLASGNYGNSYHHDMLLRLYGDNYYYSVLTAVFVYADGTYKTLSVPVFWDWFHLGPGAWSKEGARIVSVGNNPARKDAAMFHVSFANPRPAQPLKDILLLDSWLSDFPFSDIFALTLRSRDAMEAAPKKDQTFGIPLNNANKEPADSRGSWSLDKDLEGWIPGSSENWGADAIWQAESYGRKGVAVIPACNWGGDKFSWIEKKITLPGRDQITLQFLRHSEGYSTQDKQWTDGLLKIIVTGPAGRETVYEKVCSGEWSLQTTDLSRYKGQTVIIRFENHGAGQIRLGPNTSPACDGEAAIIDDIRLT